MCGTGEKWTVEALTDTIKFDHGYTATSTAIGFFLDILTELDAADQRRFLRFVTGSPRLPPGGIAALHPRSVHGHLFLCNSMQQLPAQTQTLHKMRSFADCLYTADKPQM